VRTVKFLVLPKEQWQGELVNSVVPKQPRHLKQAIAVLPKEPRQALSMTCCLGSQGMYSHSQFLVPQGSKAITAPVIFSTTHQQSKGDLGYSSSFHSLKIFLACRQNGKLTKPPSTKTSLIV